MFEIDIHVMSNAGGAANIGRSAQTAHTRARHVRRFMCVLKQT